LSTPFCLLKLFFFTVKTSLGRHGRESDHYRHVKLVAEAEKYEKHLPGETMILRSKK